jgi:hypothetical protein
LLGIGIVGLLVGRLICSACDTILEAYQHVREWIERERVRAEQTYRRELARCRRRRSWRARFACRLRARWEYRIVMFWLEVLSVLVEIIEGFVRRVVCTAP